MCTTRDKYRLWQKKMGKRLSRRTRFLDDFSYRNISPKGRIKLILSVSRAKNREEHHCESVLSPNLPKPNEILDFYRFLQIF